MDRREKLAALAQKRRQEAEAESLKALHKTNGSKKRPLSPHVEKSTNSDGLVLQALRHSAYKKQSATSRPGNNLLNKVRRKEASLSQFDDYDEGDGFVVGSEDESFEDDSEASSSEEEIKKTKSNGRNTKKSKLGKKASKDLSDVSDESIALEDEIKELDPSNVIDHGPGLRTRSKRY